MIVFPEVHTSQLPPAEQEVFHRANMFSDIWNDEEIKVESLV